MRRLGRDAFGDFGRVGIAEVHANAEGNDGEEDTDVAADVVGDAMDGGVGTESESDHDTAGTGSDWKGERVEDFLFEVTAGLFSDFVLSAVGGGVLLVEKSPSHSGEDEATGDLDDGERDTEEGKQGGADQFDDEQEDGGADGDFESEFLEDRGLGVADESEKDERGAEGIDYGEQGAEGKSEELDESGERIHAAEG